MSTDDDLLSRLEFAPEYEILGVVDPGGVGRVGQGVPFGDFKWTVSVPLAAWKPIGSQLRTSGLNVRKNVQEAEISSCLGNVEPYDVIRLRVRIAIEPRDDVTEALLIELIGKDSSDPELRSHAIKLQEEVSFVDPLLGKFVLNRGLNWFESTVDWCGSPISLTINAEIPIEVEKSLVGAKELWDSQEEWHQRVLTCASKHLLSLKNEGWLQMGEPDLTEGEFLKMLTLESISIEPDGLFEFWFDDGEIFFGHSIMVSGTLAEGPKDAGIHG
ncbi:MAG: DUF2262 domain-containing protein [Verrucomicrobiales bacterium]|nr:DUF2262 domain-containing protein [Verrucomicrobiales bacterium]